MSPRTNNVEYTKTILGRVQGVLKPRGYRKQGKTFRLLGEDVVRLVQVQSDKWSTRDYLRVTVNLGVFSRVVQDRLDAGGYSWKPVAVPAESDCHWRARLGILMPHRQDTWWEAADAGQAETVAAEIAAALVTWGLPVLEQLSSTDDLYALWRGGFGGSVPQSLPMLVRDRYLRLLGDPDVPDEPTSRARADAFAKQAMAEITRVLLDAKDRLGITEIRQISGEPNGDAP